MNETKTNTGATVYKQICNEIKALYEKYPEYHNETLIEYIENEINIRKPVNDGMFYTLELEEIFDILKPHRRNINSSILICNGKYMSFLIWVRK